MSDNTYRPLDAFNDLTNNDVSAEQVAKRITQELELADAATISVWITELVKLTDAVHSNPVPWRDEEVQYGGVRLRGSPTEGPSRARASERHEWARIAAQGWLDTFAALNQGLEIEIIEVQDGYPPSDVLNAVEAYRARHVDPPESLVRARVRLSEVNVILAKLPWYWAWVHSFAK
jgi:hypothetical protein